MKKGSLAEQVYEKLCKDVIEYGKTGRMLTEQQFCAIYGVSRTPMHEAFSRLCSEGLLTRHSKRGYTLKMIDGAENISALEYRYCLELGVVEKIIRDASDEELAALSLTLPQEDREYPADEFFDISDALHLSMAELSGYRKVTEILRMELDRLRHFSPWGETISRELVERLRTAHQAIVDAVVERDFHAAAEALRRDMLEEQD